MDSVIPVMMLVLCFFLVGGVISFIRLKNPIAAILVGIGALMAGTAAWLWW